MTRLIVLILGIILLNSAQAEPFAKATNGRVVITLYTDACALKDEVTNLSQRATWTEKGITTEGCWGYSQTGVVMAYWHVDKTVSVIPAEVFERVTGA